MEPTNMPHLTIGEFLRRHRLDASLKQKELANLLTYDHTTISRVERGERLPGETYLAEIAEALRFSEAQHQEMLALYRQ